MSARTGRLLLAASLAVTPALLFGQDRAVPRGGGGGGGGSNAGSHHSSPGVQSSGSSSSSGGSGPVFSTPSVAERRHPRAGTGSGSGHGYYPGGPGYGGGGWYYPGYGGYWWPYGYYGYYGGYGYGYGYGYGLGYGGYGGYPGAYGGLGVYYSSGSQGGSLRVLVDPAEARVYVDGYYAGVVDDFDGLLQRLHVTPGRHEITLKLEGYKSHRMRVYVGPDATLKLHYDMQQGKGESYEDLTGGAPLPEREVRRESEERDYDEPAFEAEDSARAPAVEPGKLQLDVKPEDASVYVDGAFRGSGREASSLRLAPGRHRIEVVRPGFRTAENEVEVPSGETTRLEVILERPPL